MPQTRPIYEIASDIRYDWPPPQRNFAAVPYLSAMGELNSIDDMYGADTARSVVRYFLSNAGTWRGETAREIKKELKEML